MYFRFKTVTEHRLEKLGIRPVRELSTDLELTEEVLKAGVE